MTSELERTDYLHFYPEMQVQMHDYDKLIASIQDLPEVNNLLNGWKAGATARVFLPMIEGFSDLDRILLIDSDTIVGADISELWDLFGQFNDEQIVGVTREQHKFYCYGWYTRKESMAKLPYFLPTGLNSGVMLVDLAKIRERQVVAKIVKMIAETGGENFMLGDQDVWNLYGNRNPSQLHVLPCDWNVRTDSTCPNPEQHKVIHGSRWTVHHKNMPAGSANLAVGLRMGLPLADEEGRQSTRDAVREAFLKSDPERPWPNFVRDTPGCDPERPWELAR
jgi:hypothetical protein